MTDEIIRDWLVGGIQDTALLQLLQLDADLTLEKAKKNKKRTCQREAVAELQQVLKGTVEVANSLDGINSRCGQQSRAAANGRPTGKPCTRCGKGQYPRDKCPAKEATCYQCQKKGHFGSLLLQANVTKNRLHKEVTTVKTLIVLTVSCH